MIVAIISVFLFYFIVFFFHFIAKICVIVIIFLCYVLFFCFLGRGRAGIVGLHKEGVIIVLHVFLHDFIQIVV